MLYTAVASLYLATEGNKGANSWYEILTGLIMGMDALFYSSCEVNNGAGYICDMLHGVQYCPLQRCDTGS